MRLLHNTTRCSTATHRTITTRRVTLAGNLNAVITVTDGDDDVAIDTVAIGAAISFEDDGPSSG